MMTLEEYNKNKASEALKGDTYYRIYSNAFNKSIDINTCCLDYLNSDDKAKVLRARENVEELKEIAEGKKLNEVYNLYYYNVYVPEQTKKEKEKENKNVKVKKNKNSVKQ